MTGPGRGVKTAVPFLGYMKTSVRRRLVICVETCETLHAVRPMRRLRRLQVWLSQSRWQMIPIAGGLNPTEKTGQAGYFLWRVWNVCLLLAGRSQYELVICAALSLSTSEIVALWMFATQSKRREAKQSLQARSEVKYLSASNIQRRARLIITHNLLTVC